MTERRACITWRVGGIGIVGLLLLAGCFGSTMGQVTGTITVDGETPAEGASITFFPTDGKSPSAGAMLVKGKYTASVPVGMSKVEIRVPRPIRPAADKGGDGPGGPGGTTIEESLPAKYNDQSELTCEVKSGRNEKNWTLSTKEK